MLASAASTDLPAQSSSTSHSSGAIKADVLRFAKLFAKPTDHKWGKES